MADTSKDDYRQPKPKFDDGIRFIKYIIFIL